MTKASRAGYSSACLQYLKQRHFHHRFGFTLIYFESPRPAWMTLSNPVLKEEIEKGKEWEWGSGGRRGRRSFGDGNALLIGLRT